MNFIVLEFKADFKNRIFYALNIIYRDHFIFIYFTHVAALLFELLISLQVAVSTFIGELKQTDAAAERRRSHSNLHSIKESE